MATASLNADAGSMCHRINIMAPTTTYDLAGQPQQSWTLWVQRWAAIESTTGGEFVQNQQIRNQSTHVITIRYLAGVSALNQIQYEGRVFNVIDVIDRKERKFTMDVYCKEVTAP